MQLRIPTNYSQFFPPKISFYTNFPGTRIYYIINYVITVSTHCNHSFISAVNSWIKHHPIYQSVLVVIFSFNCFHFSVEFIIRFFILHATRLPPTWRWSQCFTYEYNGFYSYIYTPLLPMSYLYCHVQISIQNNIACIFTNRFWNNRSE